MEEKIKNRRPIRSRDSLWAKWAAKTLQQKGATPNGISLFSIVCAAIAGLCFAFSFSVDSYWVMALFLLLAMIGIFSRLVCNLLDGMVAVEGGMRSPVGAIYNELPDRVSDTFIIIGLGYGLAFFPSAVAVSWGAALLAVTTAYVRLLGGTCGLEQRFSGPMAKQQRMLVLVIGSVLALLIPAYGQWILYICLWIVVLGSLLTAILRTYNIIQALYQQDNANESD